MTERLLIKQTETPRGYVVAICDAAGVPLPGQMSVDVASRPDDIATATVVFALGDAVVLSGDDQDQRSPIK